MLIPVLLESVGISMKKFKVTSKGEQKNEKGKNFIYTIPFLLLIVLSVIGIVRCVLIMLRSGSFGPVVVLFWLIYNLFLMVMALFFVDGRVPYRKTERIMVHIPCKVKYKGEVYEGYTKMHPRRELQSGFPSHTFLIRMMKWRLSWRRICIM